MPGKVDAGIMMIEWLLFLSNLHLKRGYFCCIIAPKVFHNACTHKKPFPTLLEKDFKSI
jgi:hypothetical protein